MLKFLKKRPDKKNMPALLPVTSGYAESYRTLQANLKFSPLDKNLKSVCVTSATQMEGKTNTVANLAYTMAQTGQKVLMIDGDLRKPGLTKKFGMERRPGLTELISRDFEAACTQGAISDIGIKDLLKLKKLQKRTGVLSIADSANQVEISFQSGNLTNIFWKNKPEKKKLASTLIKNKRLKKEQARMALRHQKKSGQKLGAILIIMGLISKEELKKHLISHLVEAFRIVLSMRDGKFFYVNHPDTHIHTTIRENVDFDKLFQELFNDDNQSFFLAKTIASVIARTSIRNLFLLPSGMVSSNPAKVLNSEKMTFVLDYLTQVFDFIIIDTPPVMPVSDAMLIAPNTDGVLVVLKAKKVNKVYIKNIIRQLENSGTKILGLILNCVDMKKERYYRYYKKYNTQYYGKTG